MSYFLAKLDEAVTVANIESNLLREKALFAINGNHEDFAEACFLIGMSVARFFYYTHSKVSDEILSNLWVLLKDDIHATQCLREGIEYFIARDEER
ncbi:hypothetical protein [Grimontia sp. SpTr1]|uniref:hypothetical protein n=1 Tax=Grimontia sp. SpTr1 TaxID=2995319 RepID=UPI00248AFD73|nr:hypothetical protein [Grimontia sp. SpTr1]